ncbi:hypothetical protein THC_0793 [Caldimicrobium thiodismutans]|uniref:Uncharacterized protein n=1 Tax=Caldimicrobium thiodismutans TaxID=1653476 RepID=A0A0U5B541_9BACT|nr:hypothetical protein [Caldimicrobium thiodismutans]BAU23184.1 hypothetical protein THC_0793 [Caldimicrobium thiodismutans]
MKCRLNLCLVFCILILGVTFLLGFARGKGYPHLECKRGYILDRKGEPLVLNKENYQAFFLIRGKSLLGEDVPPQVKPYLSGTLDLPKKGLVLLSNSLTLDEVKVLKEVKDVIIKGSMERRPLYQSLSPLIGRMAESEGYSGMEKVFEPILKNGKSVLTSLDTNFLKKIYYLNKSYKALDLNGVALFSLKTGELIGYYGQGEKNFLEEPILIAKEDFPAKIKKVNWELGSYEAREEGNLLRITPLHLVKAYLARVCGSEFEPTILPQEDSRCPSISEPLELESLIAYGKERWLYLKIKGEFIYVLTGILKSEEGKPFLLEDIKKDFSFLIKLL